MLVLSEATHIIGGTEKPLDVMDYIDAAVTVLGRLGIRIALPDDKLPPRGSDMHQDSEQIVKNL